MTNREWLSTLSDEDFAIWCIFGDEIDLKNDIVKQPFPRLESLKRGYTSSYDGVLEWLKEKREEINICKI